MCGIVGYVGRGEVVPVLLDGLRSLEYRGYDSSGIAVHTGEALRVVKKAGRIANLERVLNAHPLSGRCGIGHTRWATHGVATDLNAHPFLSQSGTFAVVHNGILTNYRALASDLVSQGVTFSSDTDSEAIAHLIERLYEGDVLSAIRSAAERLEGSYALAVLSLYEPNVIYGVRKDSPLVIGRGKEGFSLCSDISGIFGICDAYCPLGNGEIVRLRSEGAERYDAEGRERPISYLTRETEDCLGGQYAEDRMLSEIREIPRALSLGSEHFPRGALRRLLVGTSEDVLLLGCGSAYHAGLVFRAAMRELCGLEVRAEIASEFLTARVPVDKETLVIALSQSGETADTLRAAERAKERGAHLLSVCNVRASSLVRLSDDALVTRCGRECAVAATKSYVSQVQALLQICLEYADIMGKITAQRLDVFRRELDALPAKAAHLIGEEGRMAALASRVKDAKAVFYLGRGLDYAAAREGSLKLKEVSYLFSEAYPSGELKHGTLALMEHGVYGVLVATDPALTEKNAATIAEITCRGASAVVIASESVAPHLPAECLLTVPDAPPLFSPILSSIVMQQLAYFVAKARGCDPDRPRNLAKSVTVE